MTVILCPSGKAGLHLRTIFSTFFTQSNYAACRIVALFDSRKAESEKVVLKDVIVGKSIWTASDVAFASNTWENNVEKLTVCGCTREMVGK